MRSLRHAHGKPPTLRGLDFSNSDIRRALAKGPGEPGSILRASLELPVKCNFNCVYCSSRNGLLEGRRLAAEEMKGYITQASELGARSLIIPGRGEPLIKEPLLLEIAVHAAKCGMAPVIFSNASFLSLRLARRLYDAGASLVLKLNSFDDGIQDFLAGRAGAAGQIRKGWKNAIEAGFNRPALSRLSLETVICRQNLAGIPDLWRYARNNNIVPMVETCTPVGNAADNGSEIGVQREEVLALFKTLAAIDAKEFGFFWTPQVPFGTSDCWKYAYSIFVNYKGDVLPCIATPLVAGNIRDQAVSEILKTKLLAFTRGVPARIKEQGRSVGCRGRAFALSKKRQAFERLMDSDPLSW